MLLKIAGGLVITFGTWLLGKNVAEDYRENIKIIDSYILLIKNFKSAVSFLGINMYDFFCKNHFKHTEKLFEFLSDKRNVKEIKKFKGVNQTEDKCISLITESFLLAEESSDRELISEYLEECLLKLEQLKNEMMEDYRGKIKTAPVLGAIIGIFIAVVII